MLFCVSASRLDYLYIYSRDSLRTADVLPVVASLPPKIFLLFSGTWRKFLFQYYGTFVRSCRHARICLNISTEYIHRSFLLNNFQSPRELKERRRSKEKYVKKIQE